MVNQSKTTKLTNCYRTETTQNELSEDIAISEDLIEESVDEETQEKNGKSMRTLALAVLNVIFCMRII